MILFAYVASLIDVDILISCQVKGVAGEQVVSKEINQVSFICYPTKIRLKLVFIMKEQDEFKIMQFMVGN